MKPLSRREFLKNGTMALFSAGMGAPLWGPLWGTERPIAAGRVTTSLIYVYKEASYRAERVGTRSRDQMLNLLEEIQAPNGPAYNPRWYRINDGYVHSSHIQRVPYLPPNPVVERVPQGGLFAEVTVPFTRTFYRPRGASWQPLYRLYYESVHWIHAVVDGPDGRPWYRLSDPKNDSEYYVPAADLRPFSPAEFSPIARDVPLMDKRIVVSTTEQTVTAYEGDTVVLQTSISSGLPTVNPVEGEIPTDTPLGVWRITQKIPSRHMGDGRLTADLEAYELPGVPWTMTFHENGSALHGCFWHDNFGRKMSHGCINMRNDEALWLFRWTDPVFEPGETWYVNGLGTLVQVF